VRLKSYPPLTSVIRAIADKFHDVIAVRKTVPLAPGEKFFAVISTPHSGVEITALFLFPALAQHPVRVERG